MKSSHGNIALYISTLIFITILIIIYTSKKTGPEIIALWRNNTISETVSKEYKKVHFIGPEEDVIADAYFNLGIYERDSSLHSFNKYRDIKYKIDEFLEKCLNSFEDNSIISVDGLKFRKEPSYDDSEKYAYSTWVPYPNPPIPTLDKSDQNNAETHIYKYAKWINEHPHFGYPPIPITLEEIESKLSAQ